MTVVKLVQGVLVAGILSLSSPAWAQDSASLIDGAGDVRDACECAGDCESNFDTTRNCALACVQWAKEVGLKAKEVDKLRQRRVLEIATVPLVGLVLMAVILVWLSSIRMLSAGVTALVVVVTPILCVAAGVVMSRPNAAELDQLSQIANGVWSLGEQGSIQPIVDQLGCQQAIDHYAGGGAIDDDLRAELEHFGGVETSLAMLDSGMLAASDAQERLQQLSSFFASVGTEAEPSPVPQTLSKVLDASPTTAAIFEARLAWYGLPLSHESNFVPHALVRFTAYMMVPWLVLLGTAALFSSTRRKRARG